MVDVEVEEEHDDRPPEGTSAGAASIHASRDVTSRPRAIDAEVEQEPKVVDLRARAQDLQRSTDLSSRPFCVVDVEVEEEHDDRPPEGTSAGAASIHASRDLSSQPFCAIDVEVEQEPKVVDLRAHAQDLHRSTDLSSRPFCGRRRSRRRTR